MSDKEIARKARNAENERNRRAQEKLRLASLSEEERTEVKAHRSNEEKIRRSKFKSTLPPEEIARRKQETAEKDAIRYEKNKEKFLTLPPDQQEAIKADERRYRQEWYRQHGKAAEARRKKRIAAMPPEQRADYERAKKEYYSAYRALNWERIQEQCRQLHVERGHVYRQTAREKFLALSPEEQEIITERSVAYHRAYYERNREAILANKKRYYYENQEDILVKKQTYYLENREEKLAYNKQYYDTNAVKLNEYSRKWYIDNHEWALQRAKAYRENNPEKVRICEKACDANRRNAPGKITSADVKDAIDCSEGRCPYCLDELKFSMIHIDHVIPLSRGGHNTRENIVACCADCNLRKNDKTPREFVLGLRYEY